MQPKGTGSQNIINVGHMVNRCLIRKHGHLNESITKYVLFVISKPIFNSKLKPKK